MDIKTQNETNVSQCYPSGFCSSITDGFGIRQSMANGNDLRIGQRIHAELKRQGRTVSWLAQQLCMERTSLYYTFHQNSIDLELLLRISFFLGHDFLQDVIDAYKSCGL